MKRRAGSSGAEIAENLRRFSQMEKEEVFQELEASEEGLSPIEVAERMDFYGINEIAYDKSEPWYIFLLRSFLDPFILILAAIVLMSYLTDVAFAAQKEQSWETILIISAMILISAGLRFTQEYRSQATADKLKDLVPTTTAVKRKSSQPVEVPMENIVPGDIIHLAAGDLIPADLRIFEAKDLFIGQSALTGESEPVEKFAGRKNPGPQANASDLENIALMSTIVVSGSAKGLVLRTGNDTYFGSIAESLLVDPGETSFEEGVKSVSLLLVRFMLVMVPIVFVLNGLTKKDWLSALLFSISVAVGLTPEMLPTLVSTSLAKGALSLSKKRIIIKRLSSIQNFGAMDILCTDKTGTLTEDKIVLEIYVDPEGAESDRVLRAGYLNSYYQTGLKNLLDLAVIERAHQTGLQEKTRDFRKVDEIPFDFMRRRMSVVVEEEGEGRQLLTKGAAEEMLEICSFVELQGEKRPLTEKGKAKAMEIVGRLNAQGMRVIAVAQKTEVPKENIFGVRDEADMTLLGYMGFLDPPKISSKPAIAGIRSRGVDIKILTGDNESVTQKVAREVGIPHENVLLGPETELLSDEELYQRAAETNILAKLSPIQKKRVVSVLQSHGHVVGFLGDGINDAPALQQADVGITVDTAVDIAKESSDIIMLEKDLGVLEEGIAEGRRVFGNIVKYIKMTASSNFGNVFSVLVASAFLPFLPMLPIQLLAQNLLYSLSQVSLPWDHMDREYIDRPQPWNAGDIGKFMVFIGPISSLFDLATFWILWSVFGANTLEKAALFQSGWFVVGLLTQTLVVHMIRTRKLPFVQSRASLPVLVMTFLIMGLGIVLPFTRLGALIGLVPLPLSYFIWLAGILVLYALATGLVKKIYIRRTGSWI